MVINMKKKVYVISLIFFLFDFMTKTIITIFENKLPVTIINNFFYLERVTNKGAAFSIFNGYIIFLILISIFVILYINKYIIKEIKTKLGIISISMLMGGILGNLFDRIFYQEVIDFLRFNIFGYQFPIFNLADTFICVGIALLIIDYTRSGKSENSRRK